MQRTKLKLVSGIETLQVLLSKGRLYIFKSLTLIERQAGRLLCRKMQLNERRKRTTGKTLTFDSVLPLF